MIKLEVPVSQDSSIVISGELEEILGILGAPEGELLRFIDLLQTRSSLIAKGPDTDMVLDQPLLNSLESMTSDHAQTRSEIAEIRRLIESHILVLGSRPPHVGDLQPDMELAEGLPGDGILSAPSQVSTAVADAPNQVEIDSNDPSGSTDEDSRNCPVTPGTTLPLPLAEEKPEGETQGNPAKDLLVVDEPAHAEDRPGSENAESGQARVSSEPIDDPYEDQTIDGYLVGIDPRKRGGHRSGEIPYGQGEDDQSAISPEDHASSTRKSLEVNCSFGYPAWKVFIRLPRKQLRTTRTINIAGTHIMTRPTCRDYEIQTLHGKVFYDWKLGGKSIHVERDLGGRDFLLFKLQRRGTTGKLVDAYSKGDFLCIVPSEYTPEEALPENLNLEVQEVEIPGCLGYLFTISDGERIAFRAPDGTTMRIPTYLQQFFLEGKSCSHARPLAGGELFLRGLPTVHAPDTSSWDQVKHIAVRDERDRTEGDEAGKKYDKQFLARSAPDEEGVLRFDLPESMSFRGGAYTLLFYDKWNQLIESRPFSFHRDLVAFDVEGFSPFRNKEEHGEISVTVHHLSGANPEPLDPDTETLTGIEAEAETTSVLIPSTETGENTFWVVRRGEPDEVRFTLDFPDIWWALGDRNAHEEWGHDLLEVGPADVRATSGRFLYVKAPSSVHGIKAGFIFSNNSRYTLSSLEDGVWTIDLGQVGAQMAQDPRRFAIGKWQMILYFQTSDSDGKSNKLTSYIGHYAVRKHCVFCGEALATDEFEAHMLENHADQIQNEFFHEPTYAELAEMDKSLPKQILKCYLCNHYEKVPRVYSKSPSSLMAEHFMKCHPGENQHHISVTDPAVIRENVLTHLCEIWRCWACGKEFKTREEMVSHMLADHPEKLFRAEECE